jgi:hypothetical protein
MRAHHWNKTPTKSAAQMYETEPYETQVIDLNLADQVQEAEQQLQHAQEQLAPPDPCRFRSTITPAARP